jgi:hypothetical protein
MNKLHRLTKTGELHHGPTPVTWSKTTCAEGVNPAICMNKECNYCTEMESESGGWCKSCGTNTMNPRQSNGCHLTITNTMESGGGVINRGGASVPPSTTIITERHAIPRFTRA